MTQFDYSRALSSLMTPEVVSVLGNIRENKGKTSLLSSTHPDHFAALVEVAKIRARAHRTGLRTSRPPTSACANSCSIRPNQETVTSAEIAGYRYVLDLIHESHDDIPITPGVILQLHRDLYRYSGRFPRRHVEGFRQCDRGAHRARRARRALCPHTCRRGHPPPRPSARNTASRWMPGRMIPCWRPLCSYSTL